MNIFLIISSLSDSGGAERIMSIMANYWANKGWNITLTTFDDGNKPPFYKLSPKIKHVPLDIAQDSSNIFEGIYNNYARIKRLKQYFKANNPDVIISFIDSVNILTLLSTLQTRMLVIVSERNNPAHNPIEPGKRVLRLWLYPKASGVVCQTQKNLEYFFPAIKKNGVVIPNPVIKASNVQLLPEIQLPEGKLLFAIGSMSKNKINQKGFDLLIPEFHNLARKYNDWKLVILGDGPERLSLQQRAKKLKLDGRVYLPGNVRNIYSVLPYGELFVLSSRYEGFPNALCEAMSCGLPAVSFDCPTGPAEIIRDGIDGILVPLEDNRKLEDALDKLMSDQATRKRMGEKAREIVDRFSVEKIMSMWEEFIFNLMKTRI